MEFYKYHNFLSEFQFAHNCCLCNHDDDPNAIVDWIDNELGLWAKLIALRDIESGEEITVFYTNVDEYKLAYEIV